MHGSNIQGIVNMIKETKKYKKDIMYLEKKEINRYYKSIMDKRTRLLIYH